MLVPEQRPLGENALRLGGERVDERHPYGTSFEKATFSMRTRRSSCRFRFSMANARLLELRVRCFPAAVAREVFRFSWRIPEPYGCSGLGLSRGLAAQ